MPAPTSSPCWACSAIFFCDDRTKVRLAVAIPIVAGLVLCYSRTGPAGGRVRGRLDPRRPTAGSGGRRRAGRRTGLARQQHPGEPDHHRAVLRPVRQRQPARPDHRPGAGRDRQRRRGTATAPARRRVNIRDLEFFFHNSYLATRQEGGWVALLLVLGLLIFSFVTLAAAVACRRPGGCSRPVGRHRHCRHGRHAGRGAARHPDGRRRRVRTGTRADARPREPTRWLTASTSPPTIPTWGVAS